MKVLKWLDKNFEDVVCAFLLVSIMTMLMAQVVIRFVFGYGLTVSEELCRFMFLYLVYFAASLVALKGGHIRVTAHLQYFSTKFRLGLLMLSDLLWIGFNIMVIWEGTKLIESMASRPMYSGAMLLDMRFVYIAVPLAFCLLTFRIIQRWVRHFRGEISILDSQVVEEG